MNTQYLRYAVEVEKTGSITRAAQNLYMGQPNLSKAIRQLEQDIGITIFNRTAKGVEVTRKGAEFLAYASTILSQIDELETLYHSFQHGCLEMRIGVPRATYISDAFTRFVSSLSDEEQISIEYHESDPLGILRFFSEEELDIGIIRYQLMNEKYFVSSIANHKLHSELLWEYEMKILMSKDHPLASLNEIPYHMLSGCIEIVQGDNRESPIALSEFSPQARMPKPAKRIYVYERGSQFDLLESIPSSFMWTSPIPQEILDQKQLVQRPCLTRVNVCRDVVVYPAGHVLNGYEQRFLAAVRDNIRQFSR